MRLYQVAEIKVRYCVPLLLRRGVIAIEKIEKCGSRNAIKKRWDTIGRDFMKFHEFRGSNVQLISLRYFLRPVAHAQILRNELA